MGAWPGAAAGVGVGAAESDMLGKGSVWGGGNETGGMRVSVGRGGERERDEGERERVISKLGQVRECERIPVPPRNANPVFQCAESGSHKCKMCSLYFVV